MFDKPKNDFFEGFQMNVGGENLTTFQTKN
jgi:hypothetical protein